MIDTVTLKKAWEILDARDRRSTLIMLGVIILGAFSATLSVVSIMPFLLVLSEPSRIQSIAQLNWVYETFGFTSNYAFIVASGVFFIVMIALTSLFSIFKIYMINRYAEMRSYALAQRLIRVYLQQPYVFFLDRHSGKSSSRILGQAGKTVTGFIKPSLQLVSACLTTLALVGVMLWAEPIIASVALLVFAGSYAAVYATNQHRLKLMGREKVDLAADRYRILGEIFAGIKYVKLLGKERAYHARFAKPSLRLARIQILIAVISNIPKLAMQGMTKAGIIVICLLLASAEAIESGTAVTEIIPVIGLLAVAAQRLVPELGHIYKALTAMKTGAAAVDVVHEDLILNTRSADAALPRTPPAPLGLKRSLVLKDICYRYPRAERQGLSDINLAVRAGEKIGIVGSTGAGKTTLADVILGLLEPVTGELRVDDRPITMNNMRAWQQTVGYVPQDIFLTDATISENIALGTEPKDIDQARVEKAARIARIDQFVRQELSEGYATKIGERGVRLSGGQRQRLGIARALYHDADLIVFDEATSALDNLTESEVMEAIDALPGDKTVLMIAHRLSTVKRCDRIVVLEKGRIIGTGPWKELEADNPAFRALARGTGEADAA